MQSENPSFENGYLYRYYGPGEWTDTQHLMWIHDRLVAVHGENPLYDYMHRLRDIIEKSTSAISKDRIIYDECF